MVRPRARPGRSALASPDRGHGRSRRGALGPRSQPRATRQGPCVRASTRQAARPRAARARQREARLLREAARPRRHRATPGRGPAQAPPPGASASHRVRRHLAHRGRRDRRRGRGPRRRSAGPKALPHLPRQKRARRRRLRRDVRGPLAPPQARSGRAIGLGAAGPLGGRWGQGSAQRRPRRAPRLGNGGGHRAHLRGGARQREGEPARRQARRSRVPARPEEPHSRALHASARDALPRA